ncbi:MAG: MotA/TolQ/ExbB proton channel family protein [Candidatus Scalindua rubra]|uniref:Putative biopolymer transporter protein n=1 Tax=Candidatus Scalindua brodae TaxID=237368 RepID=A0A0B0ECZ4_9BACT|nr:MAG: putative biopolymer transporter protein [Candidatus Scalindua brodae]MBZ0110660.1 MotA/TolQ/ExbB proton channel family protein [Candidatus Scalindua rubra]TWU28919.1 Biopolymer transport protein ExbB [Candidatus Brocadiaceae bacterium S225]
MLNLILKGGPVMYPLLICSLISLTITIERIIFWSNESRRMDRKLLDEVFGEIEKGLYEKAVTLGNKSKDYMIKIVCSSLAHHKSSRINMLEMAADDEIDRMKRGMAVLDTIITMAPLLGILGTVTGIIISFDFLGKAGVEDPRAVTGGIAQALITTAAGLTIALATIIPYNYFVVKLERAARNIEKCTTSFEIYHKERKDEDKS